MFGQHNVPILAKGVIQFTVRTLHTVHSMLVQQLRCTKKSMQELETAVASMTKEQILSEWSCKNAKNELEKTTGRHSEKTFGEILSTCPATVWESLSAALFPELPRYETRIVLLFIQYVGSLLQKSLASVC